MTLAQRLRGTGDVVGMAARLACELPAYLRMPLTVEEARRRVRSGIEQRERRFLRLMDCTVYVRPRSPYRHLLAHAGCEPGDLRALVVHEGLEGALRTLADRGVYVTFDELKGRRPIVRGSMTLHVHDRDFDNPLERPLYFEMTGGSRGRPTRALRSLGTVTDSAASLALALDAFGVRGPRAALWIGATPTLAMVNLKLGLPVDAWFYPIDPGSPFVWAGLLYFRLVLRLSGLRPPLLAHCDLQDAERIVRFLTERSGVDRPVVLATRVSSAVRIAVAAGTMGRPLDGVTLYCRSEPFTAARRHLITRSGARALADYSSVELSTMAFGCRDGVAPDDQHLFVDRLAVVERTRPLVVDGPTVDALMFTSLSPGTPKIALNAELGDAARVEVRDCGCPLGALGLRTHLSEIRSFEKLSSEGTTFARSNLVQILEEILPARFGGTALDYQVVEEEARDGATLLVLRVHPDVGPLDQAAIRASLLRELAGGSIVDSYQARLLERAHSIAVRRLPPLATPAGKVLPFHLQRQPSGIGGRA